MMTVSQLMTRELVTVRAGASAVDAAKLMTDRKIGSVFVERDDRIIGIVTEPDIVRKVVGTGRLPSVPAVDEIMSAPVIGIDERRPITEAVELMEESGTRHLAVLKTGSIVGVLSVRDLLHPVSIDEF